MTIEKNPACWLAYNNRGNIYNGLGNYSQAIEDFNKAIKINPSYTETYSNRGHAYAVLGNYRQAIEDFNKAIEINPDYAIPIITGVIPITASAITGRRLRISIRRSKSNQVYADSYNNRGFAYLKQGNNISGCRDARKACELGNCKVLEIAQGRGLCL